MPKTVQTEPITLREGALRLAKRLAKAGYQAVWVGGSVRDAQIGQAPKEYDIGTRVRNVVPMRGRFCATIHGMAGFR